MNLPELISELVTDHWAKIVAGVLIFVAGRWWGRFLARRRFRRREFLDYLNVSLNTIYLDGDRPTLGIRTLLEKPAKEVFLNPIAAEQFGQYARQTDETHSLVKIPKEHRWHFLNAVLNEVAEKFAAGAVAKDLGQPVTEQTYLLFLTREVDGDVRTHKPRAMLARKDHLVGRRYEELALERPHHRKRLATLKEALDLYLKDPGHFIEMKIAMPVRESSGVPSV